MNNLQEKIDNQKNNLITSIQSVVTTRKLTSVGTAILMLGIIGVFQFVTLGCDFKNLLTWSFYLTLFYRTILVFLSYYVAVNFLYDKCMAHPDIQNAINEFRLLTKVRDINFADFLTNVYNPKRKKEAWKNKITMEIAKLERKAVRASSKKSEKYLEKIKELKTYLTDEYIDPRLGSLNVKYYVVLESDFLAAEAAGDLNIYKTRVDYDQTVFKSVIKKVLPYLLTSILMGAVVAASVTKPAHEIIISLITDLSIIILRISQGAWDTPRIINSSYLVPYTNRINILKEYINWSADQPKSKAFKLCEVLENEIENKSEKIEGE